MNGSLRIGRIAGIPISVHWSFSLLIVLVVLSAPGSSASEVGWLLLWVLALFAAVTVHELSHCVVAARRGLKVEGIVLLPIGGMSQISGLPGPPTVELEVAIAGPLASVGLALVMGLAAFATGAPVWPPTLFSGSWLARLAWLNLLLAGFNMLPALPMDGGRVLRALLARHRDQVSATRIAANVAQVIAVLMIVVGLLFDLWLILIGLFVLLGVGAERRSAGIQQVVDGLVVGDVMARDPTSVPAHVSVAELGGWLAAFPGRALPVVEGSTVVGVVAMVDLVGRPAGAPVGSVCDRTSPVLDPSTPVFPAVLETLSRYHRDEFAVAVAGVPAGVLYRSTVEQLLRGAGPRSSPPERRRAA
ncbi:MAG TPA: site-2 protease family protein [Acidimicrobiales bacterium]|nr:site-2 protease family protein [Acidimicrobiales bacterium]